MNKTYQAIALYLGVFTVAYAGFFYQNYKTRQVGPDTYQQATSRLSFDSRTPSAAGADYYSSSQPGVNSPVQHQSISKKSGSGKATTSRSETKRQEKYASPGVHRLAGKYPAEPVNYASTQAASSQLNVSSAYYNASATAYSLAAQSTTTSSNYSRSASSNTTATTGVSDTSTGASVSTSTSSNSDSSTANNDDFSTDTGYENQQLGAEEERWATENCPLQLAEGSDESDVELMQQTYGCHYINYCQTSNDGSDAYRCWWGFYSAS